MLQRQAKWSKPRLKVERKALVLIVGGAVAKRALWVKEVTLNWALKFTEVSKGREGANYPRLWEKQNPWIKVWKYAVNWREDPKARVVRASAERIAPGHRGRPARCHLQILTGPRQWRTIAGFWVDSGLIQTLSEKDLRIAVGGGLERTRGRELMWDRIWDLGSEGGEKELDLCLHHLAANVIFFQIVNLTCRSALQWPIFSSRCGEDGLPSPLLQNRASSPSTLMSIPYLGHPSSCHWEHICICCFHCLGPSPPSGA